MAPFADQTLFPSFLPPDNDDLNGWKFIEKEIRSQILKLPALKFSSNLGTPIACEMTNLKFLNEKVLSAEQLLPTTDATLKKDKPGSSSSTTAIDPYAAAHEKPFLRLFISVGEEYKLIKPRVQDWLNTIGEHDEWLIVHIAGKESGFFSRSIASTLRGDFVKTKTERYVIQTFLTSIHVQHYPLRHICCLQLVTAPVEGCILRRFP